jgi:hypothetical protein
VENTFIFLLAHGRSVEALEDKRVPLSMIACAGAVSGSQHFAIKLYNLLPLIDDW